jgi:hypothetical protein
MDTHFNVGGTMNSHLGVNWRQLDSRPNRLGIDADNMRHLKALLVAEMVVRRRAIEHDLMTVCSLSPDVALLMLRSAHESEARALANIAKATNSVEAVASSLDADGSLAEQIEDDCIFRERVADHDAAMEVLRQNPPAGGDDVTAALVALRKMYDHKIPTRSDQVTLDDCPF